MFRWISVHENDNAFACAVRLKQLVTKPVHLLVSQAKHRRMPASNAVQTHETIAAHGETSVRTIGKLSPEEHEISGRHVVIASDGLDREPAARDSFFDKLVFVLLAIVGIVARQQCSAHSQTLNALRSAHAADHQQRFRNPPDVERVDRHMKSD